MEEFSKFNMSARDLNMSASDLEELKCAELLEKIFFD